MPQFRNYPQVDNILSTDAIVLDRIGTGNVWIDGLNFDDSALLPFATIAALRAYAADQTPIAFVEGYATPSDGGDGWFVYVPTDTTSADNGGTIIVDALNRRWYRETSGAPTNGLWFGNASNVNLYISTTGNDSNNGLTAGTPFLTLQKAAAVACQWTLNGHNVVINGTGTYTAGAVFTGMPTGVANATNNAAGQVFIKGTSSGAPIVINDGSSTPAAIIALSGAQISLQNVTITSTNGSAVFPSYGAIINVLTGCTFGACALGQFHAETAGAVRVVSSYTVSGSAPAHLQAVLGGFIIFDEFAVTITVSGTPAFSIGFVDCEEGSLVYCNSNFVTISGSATGPRYFISGNGVVETEAGNATFFPGDAPGVLETGGRFLPAIVPTSISSVSGLGSGGSTALNGNVDAGAVILTAGSGASASGALTLNIPGSSGANGFAVLVSLGSGTGAWTAGAGVIVTSNSTTAISLTWTNGASTSLTNTDTYTIFYTLIPLPS